MRTGNIAHGIDIVSIMRIQKALIRSGKAFLHRIFDGDELDMQKDIGFLATRFAAKEAFFKALGTGVSEGVRWHDFQLPPGDNSCLSPIVSGRSIKLLMNRTVLVSVSRTETTAVAVVILEGTGGRS